MTCLFCIIFPLPYKDPVILTSLKMESSHFFRLLAEDFLASGWYYLLPSFRREGGLCNLNPSIQEGQMLCNPVNIVPVENVLLSFRWVKKMVWTHNFICCLDLVWGMLWTICTTTFCKPGEAEHIVFEISAYQNSNSPSVLWCLCKNMFECEFTRWEDTDNADGSSAGPNWDMPTQTNSDWNMVYQPLIFQTNSNLTISTSLAHIYSPILIHKSSLIHSTWRARFKEFFS